MPMKRLKHLNIRLQHTLSAKPSRQVEHHTSGSGYAVAVDKEDGGGRAAMWPLVSGCAAPTIGDNSNRGGAASRGEAASAVRSWGSMPRRCRCVAMEMKAGRRCGGEEGMQEARRNMVAERSCGITC
jgi:hypothetical protein